MKATVLASVAGVLFVVGLAGFLLCTHQDGSDWSKLRVKNPDDIPLATIQELEQAANQRLRDLGRSRPERIIQIEREAGGFTVRLAARPDAAAGSMLTFMPATNGWQNTGIGGWVQ